MQSDQSADRSTQPGPLIDTAVRLGVIAILVLLCFRTLNPFLQLITWALVLAVTLYPLQQGLAVRLGGRQGRAATLLVLALLLVLGVPTVMLGSSFANHIFELKASYDAEEIVISQPQPAVADWPVIGEHVYAAWGEAASNLQLFLETHREALQGIVARVVSVARNTAGALLLVMGALIVAGIMMAYGQSGSAAMERIMRRFAGGDRGSKFHLLSTMTVRSVAAGVVGVALLQALILGVGFIFAGIPAAGLLALLTLLLGIMQLPALLITLPAVAYIWGVGDASTVSNVIWTIYLIVGGLADGVLKPMLLGRGVDAPMPVILIGALGGMASSGLVGLFTGAVVLTLGYEILMAWVDQELPVAEDAPVQPQADTTGDSESV